MGWGLLPVRIVGPPGPPGLRPPTALLQGVLTNHSICACTPGAKGLCQGLQPVVLLISAWDSGALWTIDWDQAHHSLDGSALPDPECGSGSAV